MTRVHGLLAHTKHSLVTRHLLKAVSGLIKTGLIKKRDLLLGVAIFALFFSYFVSLTIFFSDPPHLIGDGAEYYAMAVAWDTTYRPFMTPASWYEYKNLVKSHQIKGLLENLRDYFPRLSLGKSQDFHHFWFYSLCAVIVKKAFSHLGFHLSIHYAFIVFHYLLLAGLLILAWYSFGWKGLAAASVLTAASPMIWYLDKVHTEFFTYALTTASVIFFLKEHYLESALSLAIASTQNPSFAPISLFVALIDFLLKKQKIYSAYEAGLLILTFFFIAIHPAYYFARFGALTPQMLDGGATFLIFGRYAYIWLIDPDVGLLPNWILGIFLLLYGIYLFAKKPLVKHSKAWVYLSFVAVYLAISLAAQSSTWNLNSGGSPGIARYALWYIGLFYPLTLLVLEDAKLLKPVGKAVISIVFVLALVLSFRSFHPTTNYPGTRRPTKISYYLQRNFPGIYNPPPQIFFGRYGRASFFWFRNAFAEVVGADCLKTLLVNPSTSTKPAVLGGAGCGYDPTALQKLTLKNLKNGRWDPSNYHWVYSKPWETDPKKKGKAFYVNLTLEESRTLIFMPEADKWYIPKKRSKALIWEFDGWSYPRQWGSVTAGSKASLTFPCYIFKQRPLNYIYLRIHSLMPKGEHLIVKIDKQTAWRGEVSSEEQMVKLLISQSTCVHHDRVVIYLVNADKGRFLSRIGLLEKPPLHIALTGIKFSTR